MKTLISLYIDYLKEQVMAAAGLAPASYESPQKWKPLRTAYPGSDNHIKRKKKKKNPLLV
jgi:hypothetical protein